MIKVELAKEKVLMKLRGGYNVFLKGRPGSQISVMPEPDALYIPLNSKRFVFSEICVEEGQIGGACDGLS